MFVVYRNTDTKMEDDIYLEWLSKKNQTRVEEGKKPMKQEDRYELESVFFWTMPQEDLELARLYWEDIRSKIKVGNIKNGVFWKLQDKRKFHVRPKGRLSADKAVNPATDNQDADKLCYWFNGDYVKEIIKEKYKQGEIRG